MYSNNGSGKKQSDSSALGGGRFDINKFRSGYVEDFSERFKRDDEEREKQQTSRGSASDSNKSGSQCRQ